MDAGIGGMYVYVRTPVFRAQKKIGGMGVTALVCVYVYMGGYDISYCLAAMSQQFYYSVHNC